MSSAVLLCLTAAFFLTAVISVVTGGTSLVTVPVMMQCGVDPRVAVATNMLALVFLSLGGTLPFIKSECLPRDRLSWLVALTLVSSALGALLLLALPARAIPTVVAVAMLAVVALTLARPRAGLSGAVVGPSRPAVAKGYAMTFVLGVYGGFFSGGYVAFLTAAYVAFFGMTFTEAVATTKVLNVGSSLVATAVFAAQGLVDWRLGALLGAVSFAGGLVGGLAARRMGNLWLRRVFLAAVIVLAVKTLFWAVGRPPG